MEIEEYIIIFKKLFSHFKFIHYEYYFHPPHFFSFSLAKSKFWILLAFICINFLSCKEKEIVSKKEITKSQLDNSKNGSTFAKNYSDGEIVLGKKLDNPYTIENMQTAYINLLKSKGAKINGEEKKIKVSHYYIRWLPKNWEEYDELKNDRNLLLFDIPLDYEVEVIGNKYHDKSIPEDLPTWQYTVIDKDYKYNKKIKHQVLAEAYLPEKDPALKNKGARLAGGILSDELINEALRITNNLSYLIKLDSKKSRISAFKPSGRVTVRDTRLNADIGVQGVYVRARRFLSIENGVTDAQGNYEASGSLGGEANYALYWEAPDFDVRSGSLGQAWINGPKRDFPWNVHLADGVNRFYAHVFRSAWRYHYGNINGLCRPGRIPNYALGLSSLLPITQSAIKYAAYDSFGSSQGINYGNWTTFGINPNIGVWRYESSNNIEYDSDEIFSTTIHETGHSTHARIVGGLVTFATVSTKIAESWACGLEHYITQLEYKERGIFNYADPNFNVALSYPLQFGFQNFTSAVFGNYTSLFIDLVDTHNQSIMPFGFGTTTNINDNINGYQIPSLEVSVVKNSLNFSSLATNLKTVKPVGVGNAQIDVFLTNY